MVCLQIVLSHRASAQVKRIMHWLCEMSQIKQFAPLVLSSLLIQQFFSRSFSFFFSFLAFALPHARRARAHSTRRLTDSMWSCVCFGAYVGFRQRLHHRLNADQNTAHSKHSGQQTQTAIVLQKFWMKAKPYAPNNEFIFFLLLLLFANLGIGSEIYCVAFEGLDLSECDFGPFGVCISCFGLHICQNLFVEHPSAPFVCQDKNYVQKTRHDPHSYTRIPPNPGDFWCSDSQSARGRLNTE